MKRPWYLLSTVLMLCGLGGAVGVLHWLERYPERARAEVEVGYLPPPAVARRLVFGYHRLAADFMWMRTIQYFGKHVGGDNRFPALRPLLDLTVALDPHFVEAYQYGGLFLLLARDYRGTITFLEGGHRRNPDRWELPHDLGRLYFLQLGNYAEALRWWKITERLPDAPTYLPRFIARLYAKAGNVQTALELWTAILNDPNTHEHFRGMARQEIARLRAQRGAPEPGR